MRHSWRLLLFRNHLRSSFRTPGYSSPHHFQFQVNSSPSLSSLRSLSSLHTLSGQAAHFSGRIINFINSKNPITYSFSSEPLVEPEKDPDHCSLVCDIFTKFTDADLINKELELNSVVITNEIVLKVLKSLNSSPVVARRFFHWVLERDSEKLSSKAYNLMVGMVGANGPMEEFWDIVETMKKKGYGVSKGARDRVVKKLEEEGLKDDLEKLKGVFASGSVDNSVEKIGLRISRIVRNNVWGDEVESQIKDLNAVFTSDLVKIVLDNLAMEPVKVLIFFRWIEEDGLYKHDETTYNAMASVLGREDCIDRFQKVLDEMKSNKYELDLETYVKVFERFVKRKMIKEAVDLYEFAMAGANKPSVHCCTSLLKKIVVSKELDMDLFSRVVRIFVGNDNALTNSTLDALLKSLTSVGRYGECNKILKEMKEGGYVPIGNMQSKIVSGLVNAGKTDEVGEFVDSLKESDGNLDYKAWASLIQRHCASGDLEKASECFQKMVEKGGASNTGYVFESLINAYCCKKRAIDASKLLHDYVTHKQLKPWHTTYKALINKLLIQGGFKDALNVLDLMKSHGFPPSVDPFIKHVSKQGTGDDAVAFMRAMTVKKFPSTSVVIRLFEAFFKAGRHSEAQDFLAKSPRYIRNHADVLNLFHKMQPGKDTAASATLAV
ncbi:pentatricopeptide repeat-containing protein At3g02490, mitochondrial [Euphorbia lathyris]|uniref:pentatricopeptide repeat-containing protein At3g02490, mitochondrial n=1 Tax=Euphorbia lathyris TaxID=212925 RepID=UPI003313FC08